MAKIDYPEELTQKYWDKKKPLLAKKKKTGIGEALKELENLLSAIKWGNFEPQKSTASLDKKLAELPDLVERDIAPISKKAKEVRKLAQEWSTNFKNEKLIPKSASEACDAIVKAANAFISELDDFEGVQAKEYVALRKIQVDTRRKTLKPIFEKTKVKIAGLMEDIKTFAKSPTEEKYWSIFVKDSNARGYTTGCKNWDQYLGEYPEIRDQCFKGLAMKEFFPCMEDYGAEWDTKKFDEKVNKKVCPELTGEAIYRFHAKRMILATPKIKEFQKVINKLISLLDA